MIFLLFFSKLEDGGNGSHRHIQRIHWIWRKEGEKACVILGTFLCMNNDLCSKNSSLVTFAICLLD
jgi:hypothetical protein